MLLITFRQLAYIQIQNDPGNSPVYHPIEMIQAIKGPSPLKNIIELFIIRKQKILCKEEILLKIQPSAQ